MPIVEDAEAPEGVDLYDFEDYDTRRNLMFDLAKTTLEGRFPMVRNGVRMDLSNVRYTDKDAYTLREQKEALLQDKFLMRRLRGKVTLTDEKTGNILGEKDLLLMRVPYLTERGTFIRDGNEWGTISQQRLLPGAYSRYQNNGDLETQFNVRPGTGNAFRVNFNPATAVYKFSIAGSQLHMYSLLKDMGVSDDEMRASWGDEVFEINKQGYDSKVLDRAYAKIVPSWDRDKNANRSRTEKAELIQRALDRSQVATDVVKHTLPNMFDSTKSAAWKEAARGIEKCSSMSKKELEDIAVFVNEAQGTHIDPEVPREQLVTEIVNVIRTGNRQGLYDKMNETDPVKAVQQYRASKIYKDLLSKVNKK